jgi:hypothetical protein
MLAVKNIMGEEHDLWNVNVERAYHEQFTLSQTKAAKAGRSAANAA